MPELPEVETVVRDLRPLLVGRRIASLRLGEKRLRRSSEPLQPERLIGRRFRSLTRRGKWILAGLDDDATLLVHLGMTGQLRVWPRATEPESHTHVVLGLDRGKEELRFRDIRRFGSVSHFTDPQSLDQFFVASGLGSEPFTLTERDWRESLSTTKRCLKAILLDQRVVAGVGNIYADESLFQAKLHPAQLGRDLTPTQANRLRRAIVTVLTRAIERRGSSIRNYVGGTGLKGEFQREFCVYGRTGQPCVRCHNPLVCMRLAGRSTHFCPACQRSENEGA